MMWPSRSRLLVMIEQAMEVRAPVMHRRLKANGRLQAELADRADVAQETYDLTIGAPDSLYRRATEDPGQDPLRKQAMFNQATSAATEQALAVAMEFPEEDMRRLDERS